MLLDIGREQYDGVGLTQRQRKNMALGPLPLGPLPPRHASFHQLKDDGGGVNALDIG